MKRSISSALTVAILSMAFAFPAWAEHHEGGGEGRHGHPGFHGWGGVHDIRHFEDHHRSVWISGRWHHGFHEGRLGWWWIAAGTWYFYPSPIYPYPDPYLPPVVVLQPAPEAAPAATVVPPPAQNWYYCEASKSYYPYVSSCAAGWKTVPATPPGAAATPPAN